MLVIKDIHGNTLAEIEVPEEKIYDIHGKIADIYPADRTFDLEILSKVNLREADFRGWDLYLAAFENFDSTNDDYIDLSFANFEGADLKFATFCRCNLKGANFRNADMSDAKLCDCDVEGADFSGADLHNAEIDSSVYIEEDAITDDYTIMPDINGSSFTPVVC